MTRSIACEFLALVLCLGAFASAQPAINPAAAPPGSTVVNFPYVASDSPNMWSVYGDGALRQQAGPPIYAQGEMLTIDGNGFNVNNNTGALDAKTGELVLANTQMTPNLAVTRRLLFNKDDGSVRYIDDLHNTTSQPITVNVQYQTVLNWGVPRSDMVPDPKNKDHIVAWVGLTGSGKAAVEVFGGKGAKLVPSIVFQNNSNVVQASLTLTIAAGKDAAIMHLHNVAPTIEEGEKWVANVKESKLLHGLPSALRRQIVNFTTGQDWIGDVEILRGDVLDLVELRGGDQIKGTLTESSFKLNTFYGPVELPVARVIAMINVGQFRPRQLVVTDDGEIFGGRLDQSTIGMEMSSGQSVQIPLDQISRLGYRKREGEPDEWTFDKPMVLMRAGDRVCVEMPTFNIDVVTRFGLLSLPPESVAAIIFQSEDNGIYDVCLTDGSKFAGLVSASEFNMKLAGAGPDQTVQFPVSGMLRLQLTGKLTDPDPTAPTLSLLNGDSLAGSLTEPFKLQTAFDVIVIDGSQVSAIDKTDSSTSAAGEAKVTLWDGTTVSGQILDSTIQCHLLSGPLLSVSAAMIAKYAQPRPRPSADVVHQIQAAVTDLSADDWRQRDQAESTLSAMGPAVIRVLQDLRPKQPPEAQERIDSIIKKLEAAEGHPAPGVGY
jgi:hypothetical protein